ncbi:TetR/AcrR family transcriptional regulator [Blastococcus sp. VKM Ac-2987]|uniref:TetR/AcrR family transcriptional regulator n=1 Tax=Blastococcus sp. VKM Ac-2987 TaxID=3004141 RepID=UPI0022AB8418|nr:TetR/AcrR family transcriptional regulator [Blastococcus sp. VKM Ac-2987]MCZ2860527.1 helix-turn-helix domain containing protein [Blastococcus sp. VKM Ac-2987]
MARPFRQQADDDILDRAAALFARRGFTKTSLQDIADAVGLSKAGLLHHFPSKEALYDAVLAQAGTLGQRVLAQVRDLPLGADRDRRAIDVLVDIAFDHPGVVALLLTPLTQGGSGSGCDESAMDAAGAAALEAFGVPPGAPVSERAIRAIGALSALAVLTLAAHAQDEPATWRAAIVATCFDALGHSRPGAALPVPHQVEV